MSEHHDTAQLQTRRCTAIEALDDLFLVVVAAIRHHFAARYVDFTDGAFLCRKDDVAQERIAVGACDRGVGQIDGEKVCGGLYPQAANASCGGIVKQALLWEYGALQPLEAQVIFEFPSVFEQIDLTVTV